MDKYEKRFQDLKMEKWIKILFECKRENDDMTDYAILKTEKIDFSSVKKEIRKHFSTFSGRGSIKIKTIATGPYSDDKLTAEQIVYFFNKVYRFAY